MRRPCSLHRCPVGLLLALVGLTVIGYGILLTVYRPIVVDGDLEDVVLGRMRHRHHDEDQPTTAVPTPAPVPLDVERASFCGGRWTAYGRQFARVRGLVVDRTRCVSTRSGGEPIDAVLNQDESVEYYRYERGCFRLDRCDAEDRDDDEDRGVGGRSTPTTRDRRKYGGLSVYSFVGDAGNHLNAWLQSLQIGADVVDGATTPWPAYSVRDEFTVAVTRYEYVNLYHTMTDWYNAYLLARYFGRHPASTHILFVDAHPQGSLDPVWSRLFNSSRRLADLPADRPTYFDDIVWGWIGYNSPISIYASAPRPPLIEEFAMYFLSAFGITWQNRTASTSLPEVASNVIDVDDNDEECGGRRLSALFIWRHDYVAHPRNPSGSVSRKIANEDQLLQYVRTRFPRMRVDGVQIDAFPMDEQLKMIAATDILIGMHGAGMTHAIFLAPGSAVIELAPSYWSLGEHFAAIAGWRRLDYYKWVNVDLANELPDGRTTKIPPNIVAGLIGNAMRKICSPRGGVEASTDVSRRPAASGIDIR